MIKIMDTISSAEKLSHLMENKNFMKMLKINLLLISLIASMPSYSFGKEYKADVCVYGGSASGMMAAIAAAQRDKSVVVIEPSRWLGGFIGGGSRIMRDCVYADDIGGLTRMMMSKDIEMDGGPSLDTYTKVRGINMGFGPHDKQPEFRKLFADLGKENGIEIIYEHRLGVVELKGKHIQELKLDYAPPQKDGCPAPLATKKNAIKITAKVFIDASYDGDLMAEAGVPYTVGRESKDQYGESLAGQRNLKIFNISPYLKKGDPSSGLLPMIDSQPYVEGAASRHIIAYNFRLFWMKAGKGVLPGEPSRYTPQDYALAHRALEDNKQLISWPHNNYNRYKMISSGIPGRQADYPDADWPKRAKIWREWIDHVKIMHKITGSKRGLMTGEYPETNDFPHYLYTRLARRMIGEYVMTQHDLMLQTDIDNPIALGYYMVDIYPCRLIATPEGKVASEGETSYLVSPGPYQIPYGSITPSKKDCDNLLVPVCISASHTALASIRMEPTYMIMGEAAGIAAARSLEENVAVQNIDQKVFRKELLEAGMIVQWDGTGYESGGVYGKKPYWITNPEEYSKKPYRSLYKGRRHESATGGSGQVRDQAFSSIEDWNRKKPGYAWLFPYLDKNADGKISREEHQAFQEYKKKNNDWTTTLKAKLVRE